MNMVSNVMDAERRINCGCDVEHQYTWMRSWQGSINERHWEYPLKWGLATDASTNAVLLWDNQAMHSTNHSDPQENPARGCDKELRGRSSAMSQIASFIINHFFLDSVLINDRLRTSALCSVHSIEWDINEAFFGLEVTQLERATAARSRGFNQWTTASTWHTFSDRQTTYFNFYLRKKSKQNALAKILWVSLLWLKGYLHHRLRASIKKSCNNLWIVYYQDRFCAWLRTWEHVASLCSSQIMFSTTHIRRRRWV